MALSRPQAPWSEVAGSIQVFKLYGEWVAYHASEEELREVVVDLEQRGLALAVEAGPLNAPADCGQGIEGFAGTRRSPSKPELSWNRLSTSVTRARSFGVWGATRAQRASISRA